ncbi:hypothetical protein LV84_04309 [Algoriphagus ratkowskyi]|uniref:Uncharacterized protein n=1 Tax=Algoriphagus ratkowskyi TaxID=57028 RepID=A0A2W7QKS7_9BACT|nr:hypothetical protein [Algoriphagus ratkowskyi]PZX49024.1 hypothetical protein LV84_04309 [Algoriphagus ratkowskyi]TXD75346.1 hypothetical protein ESW18_20850 [Algoriphagus ratkowskyi]
MKRLLILLLTITPFITFGQQGKAGQLKKNVNLDTLYVSVQFSDTNDLVLQKELLVQFDTIVSVFNRKKQAFKLVIDSTQNNRTINFLLGPIKYVDWKKNVWVTGLDVALIGANILILPYFPPVIPFYLMPATLCRVDLKSSDDLFYKPTRLFLNPNGYFTKKEKQKLRFKKKFNKLLYKCFFDLNEQNKKNNKL